MRHRRKGRKLGRNPNHQRALLRSLATALILTEEDIDEAKLRPYDPRPPKNPGRIVTTLEKAKEVKPLVEKCVTLARKAQKHIEAAKEFDTKEARGSSQWKSWRESEQWQKWNATIAPAIALRRKAYQILGNKKAVKILFDKIGPRFLERDGGYTRIMRLAKPRLGDAGTRAILEFVGKSDRTRKKKEALVPSIEE